MYSVMVVTEDLNRVSTSAKLTFVMDLSVVTARCCLGDGAESDHHQP